VAAASDNNKRRDIEGWGREDIVGLGEWEGSIVNKISEVF
jgi:hypothetical protein